MSRRKQGFRRGGVAILVVCLIWAVGMQGNVWAGGPDDDEYRCGNGSCRVRHFCRHQVYIEFRLLKKYGFQAHIEVAPGTDGDDTSSGFHGSTDCRPGALVLEQVEAVGDALTELKKTYRIDRINAVLGKIIIQDGRWKRHWDLDPSTKIMTLKFNDDPDKSSYGCIQIVPTGEIRAMVENRIKGGKK